jgi:hypothetical protein
VLPSFVAVHSAATVRPRALRDGVELEAPGTPRIRTNGDIPPVVD